MFENVEPGGAVLYGSGFIDTLLLMAILNKRMSGMRVITIPLLMAALVGETLLYRAVS